MSTQNNFSKSELERYSRQILLYGRAGQERLKQARVIVIGAGGLGSTFLPVIAASGVGSVVIYDGDSVERSNLGRQLLYSESDIGAPKAIVAAERLRALNPFVGVQGVARRFGKADADMLRTASLVFEGSDSLASKFLLNDLCLAAGIPLVVSALGNAQGHTMLITDRGSACYRCVFEEIDEQELPTCANEGILSAFPAFVGAQAAHVAIRCLLGLTIASGFWVFEKSHCRSVRINRRKDCLHPENA